MGNNGKIRVHAAREGRPLAALIETECGVIGRTQTSPDEYRTALGNPFKIAGVETITCKVCKQWVKVRK